MFVKLLLLFTLGPLVELYLLIELGRRIGPLPTIAIVLTTGFFGVFLSRAQGFLVLRRIAENLRCGEMPADELLNGVMVLIGAAFLLTPGLISDTAGFLLLIPATRQHFKRFLLSKLKKAMADGTLRIYRR
ncbi:MAG: FxsA family protein [Bacillota bacterium]|nr:FxsA family protein [Bacillota bacterium]MDW7684154.1 FxsA family protein [Bacillota bacterium]